MQLNYSLRNILSTSINKSRKVLLLLLLYNVPEYFIKYISNNLFDTHVIVQLNYNGGIFFVRVYKRKSRKV